MLRAAARIGLGPGGRHRSRPRAGVGIGIRVAGEAAIVVEVGARVRLHSLHVGGPEGVGVGAIGKVASRRRRRRSRALQELDVVLHAHHLSFDGAQRLQELRIVVLAVLTPQEEILSAQLFVAVEETLDAHGERLGLAAAHVALEHAVGDRFPALGDHLVQPVLAGIRIRRSGEARAGGQQNGEAEQESGLRDSTFHGGSPFDPSVKLKKIW